MSIESVAHVDGVARALAKELNHNDGAPTLVYGSDSTTETNMGDILAAMLSSGLSACWAGRNFYTPGSVLLERILDAMHAGPKVDVTSRMLVTGPPVTRMAGASRHVSWRTPIQHLLMRNAWCENDISVIRGIFPPLFERMDQYIADVMGSGHRRTVFSMIQYDKHSGRELNVSLQGAVIAKDADWILEIFKCHPHTSFVYNWQFFGSRHVYVDTVRKMVARALLRLLREGPRYIPLDTMAIVVEYALPWSLPLGELRVHKLLQ
jgi:hypothetical protein